MSDVQKEILDNLRTIRDQTRQIAELDAERDRLREALRYLKGESAAFLALAKSDSDVTYWAGNTNIACLQLRIDEARAALAASEQKEPK